MKIKEKSTKSTIFFPKNIVETNKNHSLILKSELTLNTYTFDVTDEQSYQKYYVFTIDTTGIDTGEYVYTIDNSAKGIIIIGDYNSTIDRVEFENDTNTYVVYND